MAWISRVYSNSIEIPQAQIKIKSQEDELARLRLRKMVCSSGIVELKLKQVREAIWTLYRTLKQATLEQKDKASVHQLYSLSA